MMNRAKLPGPFDQVYAKDDKVPMTKSEMQKKAEELNPKGFYILSFMMDPLFRSAAFLHSWVLYLIVKLMKARFSIIKLAQTSLVSLFFDVEKMNHVHLLSLYFINVTIGVTLILFISKKIMSRGKRLPSYLLKRTNLKGKVAIVTGGYSGIGYETVLQLLKWNCKVVICGRNKTKATEAIEKLKSTNSFDHNNVSFIEMDLDNLISVEKAVDLFLKNFDRLDFLINNAGTYIKGCELTDSNLERNFSSNFLGHYCLTTLLLDVIKKSEGRILNVSSISHYNYDPEMDKFLKTKDTAALDESEGANYYSRSKFFMIWFARSLQRKLREEKQRVLCFSLAPGIVKTQMTWPMRRKHRCYIPRFLVPFILKSPADGAATTLYLCIANPRELIPGAYYSDCNLGLVSRHINDREKEDRLCKIAQEIIDDILT